MQKNKTYSMYNAPICVMEHTEIGEYDPWNIIENFVTARGIDVSAMSWFTTKAENRESAHDRRLYEMLCLNLKLITVFKNIPFTAYDPIPADVLKSHLDKFEYGANVKAVETGQDEDGYYMMIGIGTNRIRGTLKVSYKAPAPKYIKLAVNKAVAKIVQGDEPRILLPTMRAEPVEATAEMTVKFPRYEIDTVMMELRSGPESVNCYDIADEVAQAVRDMYEF